MPRIGPGSSQGATQLSGNLWSQASQLRSQSIGTRDQYLAEKRGDKQQILNAIRVYGDYARQKKAEKAAEVGTGWFGIAGAGAGAVAGLVLAPFTFGTSLIAYAAAATTFGAAGASIGGSFDKDPAQAQQISQGLGAAGEGLSKWSGNEYKLKKETGDTGQVVTPQAKSGGGGGGAVGGAERTRSVSEELLGSATGSPFDRAVTEELAQTGSSGQDPLRPLQRELSGRDPAAAQSGGKRGGSDWNAALRELEASPPSLSDLKKNPYFA